MKCWNEYISHVGNPFFLMMLVDTFKRVIGEKLFCQPLADEMNNIRRLEKLFSRLLSCFKRTGNDQVPLFLNSNGNGLSIKDFLFHGLLKEVQHLNSSVIPDSVNIV